MTDKQFEKLLADYDSHCRRVERATTLKLGENSAEKNKRIRKLESSYTDWFEYYFPLYAKAPCAPYHKKLAKLIIDNKIINVLSEIFRSGAKSTHVCMGIPLYLYLAKGDLKFMLLLGETEPKAKKLLSDIQAQLQFNQRLIDDYGRKFKLGNWADGDFTTTDGVKFVSLGFGQSPRGIKELSERPDYIVPDDVDSKKRCKNPKLSREAFEYIWEDIRGTFDEGGVRQRFICANNNFHKNTIINQLKEEFKRINKIAKSEGFPIRHHILTVPAVKDLVDFEPAWKDKTDSQYWRRKFLETPYRSFMREYMHTHIQEGTIFKNEQILYKKRAQLRQYDGLVFYGDLSYKNTGDYKAMPFVGKIGREYHLLAMYNRQSSRAAVAEWLYNIYEDRNLSKYNIRYFIEGLFAQDDFVNDFDIVGDSRGYHIPVVADKRPKADKFDRVEGMSGHFERKNFFIDEALKDDPDTLLFIEHLLAFEKGSKVPDDSPDAVQGAISKLNGITFVEKFEPRIITRKQRLSRKSNRY